MDQYQYINSKRVKKAIAALHTTLIKAHKKEKTPFTKNGKTLELTKHQATLGLMILNCFPDDREDYEKKRWSYVTLIQQDSKRHKSFVKYYGNNIWNDKTEDLLWFFFGDELAPLFLKSWDNLGKYMYQTGLYRRSFRRPNAKDFIYVNQLNFLINCANTFPKHQLSLAERLEYDNVLGYQNWYLAKLLVATEDPTWETAFLDIAYNRHPKIKLSHTFIQAMLSSPKEEYWKAIADVLLAAQRQEGLRQSILQTADAGHVGAFIYLIKTILEHKLTRFSATLRAIETWIGLGWEAEKESTIKRFLQLGYDFITQPDTIANAVTSKDNAQVYMALWAQGVIDVDKCAPYLETIWNTDNVEKRTLVLIFVGSSQVPELQRLYAKKALDKANLQLLAFAQPLLNAKAEQADKKAYIEQLKVIAEKLTQKEYVFTGKVFAWSHRILKKEYIYGNMLNAISQKSVEEAQWLLPLFNEFNIYQRERITGIILKEYYTQRWSRKKEKTTQEPTPLQRDFAISVLKDRSNIVQTSAITALKNTQLKEEELHLFESLLTRKSAGLREQLIDLLVYKEETSLQSAQRLLAAKNVEQRLAGLDVIIQLQKQEKFTAETSQLALEFKKSRKLTNREEVLLENILDAKPEYTKANGYGLYDPAAFTQWQKPKMPTSGEFVQRRPDLFVTKKGLLAKKPKITYGLSKPVAAIEKDLEQLKNTYLSHTEYEYTLERETGNRTVLLGNSLSYKKRFKPQEKATERQVFEQFPLYEVWEKWWLDAQLSPFDLYVILILKQYSKSNYESIEKYFPKAQKSYKNLLPDAIKFPSIEGMSDRYYDNPILRILQELRKVYTYEQQVAYQLGAMQYIGALVDDEELYKVAEVKGQYNSSYYHFFQNRGAILWQYNPPINDASFTTYYRIIKWKDEAMRTVNKNMNDVYYYNRHQFTNLHTDARAYQLELIGKDELMASVMRSQSIEVLTAHKHPKRVHILEDFPFLQEFLDSARDRILEIELHRGDKATPVTLLATSIKQLYGQDNFFKLVKALGKGKLHKGYVYSYGGNSVSKTQILSTLLKRCLLTEGETQENFNTQAEDLNLSEKRWVELAMYAQQWSHHISTFLHWDEAMHSAIWWLHAHTTAHHSKETESEIAKYSPVTLNEFSLGNVDVAWFKEVYKKIGKARWKMLYDAAKYITDGTGYTRAKLYADVLTGDKKIREVSKRVQDKRNQDYLRVYGLVPLSKKIPEKDVLNRYLYIQQFLKESKQFGAQRQTSEKLAAQVSMENLARNADYSDPMRLTWAMESKQAQTIIANAQTLTYDGDLTVEMVIKDGKPSVIAKRKDKPLKNIPAKLRKDKDIQELKDFVKQLKEQYSRSRKSLEEAMIRSSMFYWEEIQNLFEHPVIKPMVSQLVFKTDEQMGFASTDGLHTIDAVTISLTPKSTLRIAHAHDLFTTNQWEAYQKHCFHEKVKQPFKQIFRELYVPTPDELHSKTVSKRYEGHQVQPSKTVALLKGRGWRVSYEEGLQKVYHNEGVIAKMYAMADWFSPADIEAPTLETIQFLDLRTYKPIAFTDLSPIIFSEVMRDLDLVVAVAHVGDVDPETSQSSVEMRAVLVNETARLFKLDNVTTSERHVHIKGTMAEYSIHLGSAQVFQKPGRQLGVIPIHSQHRGRIFLPFADDDPKSAELLSKVLLFAKDNEIQDPTILNQLNLVVQKK